jgi:hypothetical protein
MDDVLGCLLDILVLLKMEPERVVRVVPVVADGMEALEAFEGLVAIYPEGGFSCLFLVAMVCGSRMLPSPFGDGNWASLKSEEADSMLAWRSSKLTEGKKS